MSDKIYYDDYYDPMNDRTGYELNEPFCLLNYTLITLEKYGKTLDDIIFVGNLKNHFRISWTVFEKQAKKTEDDCYLYNRCNIIKDLVVVGKDFWLQYEYEHVDMSSQGCSAEFDLGYYRYHIIPNNYDMSKQNYWFIREYAIYEVPRINNFQHKNFSVFKL